MTLASRIAILKDGLLQQYDTPSEIYRRPANLFVAGFVGSPSMNLLPGVDRIGRISQRRLFASRLRSMPVAARSRKSRLASALKTSISRSPSSPAGPRARVWVTEDLGNETLIRLALDGAHMTCAPRQARGPISIALHGSASAANKFIGSTLTLPRPFDETSCWNCRRRIRRRSARRESCAGTSGWRSPHFRPDPRAVAEFRRELPRIVGLSGRHLHHHYRTTATRRSLSKLWRRANTFSAKNRWPPRSMMLAGSSMPPMPAAS